MPFTFYCFAVFFVLCCAGSLLGEDTTYSEVTEMHFTYCDPTGREAPGVLRVDNMRAAIELLGSGGRTVAEIAASSLPGRRVELNLTIGRDRLSIVGPPTDSTGFAIESRRSRKREAAQFADVHEADSAVMLYRHNGTEHGVQTGLTSREQELYRKGRVQQQTLEYWSGQVSSLGTMTCSLETAESESQSFVSKLCTLISTAHVEEDQSNSPRSKHAAAWLEALTMICDKLGNSGSN